MLGEQRQHIREVREHVLDRTRRVEDIAEVLPRALQETERQHRALLEHVLKDPVSSALRRSIQENPQAVSDLLFPIILPAVRKSVEEALKNFLDKIDAVLANAFSGNALRWRWEALTSGVPYREVVLRNAFVYQTEQVFLIDRQSGLLIDHVFRRNAPNVDEDAVAGMLTAIQHFFNDSFSETANEALDKISFGNRSIFLLHGARASLALLVFGSPTGEYLERQRQLLGRLHEMGVPDPASRAHIPPALVQDMLGEALDQDLYAEVPGAGRSRVSSWIVGAMIGATAAGLFIHFVPRQWEAMQIEQLAERIDREQDWGVVRTKPDGEGGWVLTLVHEPPPEVLRRYIEASGIHPSRLKVRSYLGPSAAP